MSKIFDLGRTPEEWSAKLRPRGVELSPRTLRSKAREHGQYFSIGRAIFITPDQMDEILLREADRTSRFAERQHNSGPKGDDMPAPITTQAAIRRALEAAKDIGLIVAGYTVAKDGTISVTLAGAEAGQHARPAPRQTAPKSWATR